MAFDIINRSSRQEQISNLKSIKKPNNIASGYSKKIAKDLNENVKSGFKRPQ